MQKRIFELIQSIKHKCIVFEEGITRELDLLSSEFYALMALSADDKISQSQLSNRLNVSTSRGSRILTSLLEKNIVKSENMQDDRRSIAISLTEKGVDLKEKVIRAMVECEENITSSLKVHEVSEIQNGLTRLDTRLENILHSSTLE